MRAAPFSVVYGWPVSDAPERLYKVAFDLPDDVTAWAPGSVERLWVAKTAVRTAVEVRNTPFYVRGIAFGDIVRVRADDDRRELVFDEFVAGAGNSTVRVIVMDKAAGPWVEDVLGRSGCSWEVDNTGVLWAVHIPADVDYRLVREALLQSVAEGRIGVQEAALAAAHRAAL